MKDKMSPPPIKRHYSLCRFAGTLLITLVISLGLIVTAQAKKDKPVKLSMASLFPPESPSANH